MDLSKKMGFWGVFSLVVGSQIGSGVFLLPSTLAPFGTLSLIAWVLTGAGAVALALVFSHLCEYLPKTGGPHVYITDTFGKSAGFYTAWSYWLISWISSIPLVTTILFAFAHLIGDCTKGQYILMAFLLVLSLGFLNLRGVKVAGIGEIILSALKIVPLVLIPLSAMFYVNTHHFVPLNPTDQPFFQALNGAALLVLWGFIGVETATTPAGNVENPKKNIPRGLIWGTALVAIIYFFNTFTIMGVIPPENLLKNTTPYMTVTQIIWGQSSSSLLSIMTIIMCVGTLNAWVLACGQIAKGAAEDNIFPHFFKTTTPQGGPLWGIVLSTFGMFFVFTFFQEGSLLDFSHMIIELSSLMFLVIYGLCSLAFLSLLITKKITPSWKKWCVGTFALAFCTWTLWDTGWKLLWTMSIPLSGIGVKLIWETWRYFKK